MNKSSINFIKKDYEKFNKENCFTIIKGVQHFAQPRYILFLKNNLIDFLESVKECYYFKLDYFKLDYFKKNSKNNIKGLFLQNKNTLDSAFIQVLN